MPDSTFSTSSSSPHYRIDPDHQIFEMMAKALTHLNRAIRVELSEDAVLLRGVVDSWAEKQQAQESIRGISGARMIHNHLEVFPVV